MDWIEIAALIIIPIAAVLIGQWLQNRAEKRNDIVRLFFKKINVPMSSCNSDIKFISR